MSQKIKTAFVLGAGLGTRLRPLTNERPKPLVPIFNKPLITFVFDHLIDAGITRFVVNTHHRPEAYSRWLGEREGRAEYRGRPIFFRHEPVLLETGGGIKNAADLIGDEPFLVYNADVLADFPLVNLLASHADSPHIATLALRSSGAERRIQCDPACGRITDMRGLIGGRAEPSFLFTGVSVFSPEIFNHIPQGDVVSIIPVLVDLMRLGAVVGGEVINDGVWFDIGNINSYMDVHRMLHEGAHTFSYLPENWMRIVEDGADVHPQSLITGCSAVAAGSRVESGACLENVIVWPGACVPAGSKLSNAVVTSLDTCLRA